MPRLNLLTLLVAGTVLLGTTQVHAGEKDGPKTFIRPNPTVQPEYSEPEYERPNPTLRPDRRHDHYDNHRDNHGYSHERGLTITNNTDVDLYFDVNGRTGRLQDEHLYPGQTRHYRRFLSANIVFDYNLNRSGIQQKRQKVYGGESFVFELDRDNYLRLVEDYGFSSHNSYRDPDHYPRPRQVCHGSSGLCLSF